MCYKKAIYNTLIESISNTLVTNATQNLLKSSVFLKKSLRL